MGCICCCGWMSGQEKANFMSGFGVFIPQKTEMFLLTCGKKPKGVGTKWLIKGEKLLMPGVKRVG